MMKKNCLLLSGLLMLTLLLAGCGGEGPTAGGQPTAGDQPSLLYFYGGVINTEGQLLMPANGAEYTILSDTQNRQCYILETENIFDSERLSHYGEPLQVGCNYRIYDTRGELQKELNLQVEGPEGIAVRFEFAKDGDLAKSRILVNRLSSDGYFQILDPDGNVLVQERMTAPEELADWPDGYAWLDLLGGFMAVHCSVYSEYFEELREHSYFYNLTGEPLTLAQDYQYVYVIYDNVSWEPCGYYALYYEGPQGQSLYDVVDDDGNLLISGVGYVEGYADSALVTNRGFERGLMNMQGEWIYHESTFTELED